MTYETIGNNLWILLGGLLCVTIVGIPFGKQFFNSVKVALRPFGARVEPVDNL